MSVILTLFLSAVNSTCMLIIVNEQQHNQELFFNHSEGLKKVVPAWVCVCMCVCLPLKVSLKKVVWVDVMS